MKDQWKQGLQWGSVAWLACMSFATLNANAHYFGRFLGAASHRLACGIYGVESLVMIAALALSWTRWSRLGIAAALVAQLGTLLVFMNGYPRPPLAFNGVPYLMVMPWPIWFAMIARYIPLLPLLVMAPERPCLTGALALLGRFRDALRTLHGWRWPLVAIATFMVGEAINRALLTSYEEGEGVGRFAASTALEALAPCALLFVLAALPTSLRRGGATA